MRRVATIALVSVLCACAAQHATAGAMEMPSGAPRAPGGGGSDTLASEMVDIRAKLQLEVESVPAAATTLRRLVQDNGGQIVGDDLNGRGAVSYGSFDVRVPAEKANAFLDAAGALGRVLLRNVTSTDVSKQYHDAGLLLQNLQATLRRYEELLAKATDVKDMLAIEAELARVRREIDKVMGERRWMEDRVARATIHIDLSPLRPEVAEVPRAKFYPGLKASFFKPVGGDDRTSLWGTGLSAQFGARVSVDLDLLRRTSRKDSLLGSVDLMLLTVGGEFYSDLLGGGRRRFLNPYLGARLGYGRSVGEHAFVLGATGGVELVRLESFVLDAQVQGLGLFGPDNGPGAGVQSSLTARVAF